MEGKVIVNNQEKEYIKICSNNKNIVFKEEI